MTDKQPFEQTGFDIDEEKEVLLRDTGDRAVRVTRTADKTRRLLPLILFVTCGLVIVFSNSAVLRPPRHGPYALTSVEDWYKAYRQDRPIQQFGLSDEYVEINKEPMEKRIEDMRLLNQIKFGHCGRFEDFLTGDKTTNWVAHSLSGNGVHCRNGQRYKKYRCKELRVERFVCEAEHPEMNNVTVTIERSGQFIGRGGYDWTSTFALDDVGELKQRMWAQDTAFVGGMAVPVYANGTIIGYPPLHIHHAHIFPYGDFEERAEMIKGGVGDHHDILFQSHGDTECHDEEGGVACLLKVLDPDMVRVVQQSKSGVSGNFEINDVRQKGSDELQYWFEIVL